jgi:hypothetical protein
MARSRIRRIHPGRLVVFGTSVGVITQVMNLLSYFNNTSKDKMILAPYQAEEKASEILLSEALLIY